MAYDARKREVLDALGKTTYDEEKKQKIRRLLDEYFKVREGLIANTHDVLDPGRKGPCLAAWLDRGDKNLSTVRAIFEKAEVGKLWLADIANAEFKFFGHLMFSRVPVHRDKMMKHTEELNRAMKEFANKWQEIKGNDNEIDERMRRVSEEYEKILTKAAYEAAKVETESKEKLANLVDKSVSAGGVVLDAGLIGRILSGGTKLIKSLVSECNARKMEIFALLSNEEKVYGAFAEAREIVEEFLEENGYPKIKDAWDEGDDATEDTVKKMLTDGQKDDAAVWAREARDQLSKVFSVAEKAYREFASKHEYVFFGPLGSGYYRELSEDGLWKDFSSKWRDRREDFDDLLRDRTLAASEDQVLEVSLQGLSREDRKKIYKALHSACRELLRSWNEIKEVAKRGSDKIMTSRESVRYAIKAMT